MARATARRPHGKKPATSPAKKASPTLEQVRSWLATVLNPIAQDLSVELDYLQRGRWAYRCHARDLDYFMPIARMVLPTYQKNYTQLLRYLPRLATLVQKHDVALDEVRKAAIAAHGALIDSEDFRCIVADEDARKYLAEYAVNRIVDLPDHYALQQSWSTLGPRIRSLVGAPGRAHDAFVRMDTAGEHLGRAVRDLAQRVDEIIQRLADSHGLPAVDERVA